mgnify:CR=1 FL=1
MRYSRIVHLAKRGTGNKKGNPISEISFLDSGLFARTHKLEFVVQGNCPSIASKCVFSMQLYVLLEGYVSESIPVGQVLSSCQCFKNIGIKTGAAEVNISIYIVVSNSQIPSASFLPVRFAIGEAC